MNVCNWWQLRFEKNAHVQKKHSEHVSSETKRAPEQSYIARLATQLLIENLESSMLQTRAQRHQFVRFKGIRHETERGAIRSFREQPKRILHSQKPKGGAE